MTVADVQVRYFAAAKAAAGTGEQRVVLAGDSSVDDLLLTLAADSADLAAVLDRCSFLLNGVAAGRDARLSPGDQLDVLPPFAGG